MKFLKFALATVICLAVIFSACKKTDVFTDRQSYGSLIDSSGECLPKNVEGIYKESTPLAVDNYIDVHVIVDTVGAYEIKTDSVNGYYFKGTGTFGIKGDNLVRLYGHGSPDISGTDIFTVSYGSTSCSIAVKVIPAPHADFILDTTAGGCPGTKTEGTLSTNIPATSANKATLAVLVTKLGVYNIKIDPQYGIAYQAKGIFTKLGPQTIDFIASGTPIASGDFNFEAKVNGTSCIYSVHVADGPPLSTTAVFTLGGSPSDCTGFVLSGDYKAGTALTISNTVKCDVNVTTIGDYTLLTNSVNGISFATFGTFTSTGPHTVILNGIGTPISSAPTNSFTLTEGGSSCSFNVVVLPGSGGGGPVVSTDFYFKGTINSKSVAYNVNTPPNIIGGVTESKSGGPVVGPYFYWEGFDISDFDKQDTNDIDVSIGKQFSAEPVTSDLVGMFHLGSYSYGAGGGASATEGAFITYKDENGVVWTSYDGSQAGSTFSITELIDDTVTGSSKKIFTAKFSCKLYDYLHPGTSISVVNGEIRGGVVSP